MAHPCIIQNWKKNLIHLDIGSLRELLLHKKLSFTCENGCKFAVYSTGKTIFQA